MNTNTANILCIKTIPLSGNMISLTHPLSNTCPNCLCNAYGVRFHAKERSEIYFCSTETLWFHLSSAVLALLSRCKIYSGKCLILK